MALFGRKKEEGADEKKEKKTSKATKSSDKKDGASESARDYTGVLLSPRITEKAAIAAESGAYVFNIPMHATKDDVAKAVEHVYNVTPKKISIVRMKQQNYVSRTRGRIGKYKGFKKAYVHVKKGDRIEVL